MRDGPDPAGGAPQGGRGLAACDQCQGIFPASRLLDGGGRLLCTDCGRKFGDGDAAAPGAPAPAESSYDARLVVHTATVREPSSGRPAAPQYNGPPGTKKFTGRYALRASAKPPEAEPAPRAEKDSADSDPGAVVEEIVAPAQEAEEGPRRPAFDRDAYRRRFGEEEEEEGEGEPEPSSSGTTRFTSGSSVLDRAGMRNSSALPPWAQQAPQQAPPPLPGSETAESSPPPVPYRQPGIVARGVSGPPPVPVSAPPLDRSGMPPPPAAAGPGGGQPRAGITRAAIPPWEQQDARPGRSASAEPRHGSFDPAAARASQTGLPGRVSQTSLPGRVSQPGLQAPVPGRVSQSLRASQTGTPGRISQTTPLAASAPAAEISRPGPRPVDRFVDYAELRQRIDGGDDTLENRRRAAEMASRLGLHVETLEHYRRAVELAPDDEGLRHRFENVHRAVNGGPGGNAAGTEPPSRRIPDEARPFWEDLGNALSYPFRGAGLAVLLVGGALFGVGQLIGTINVFAWSVNIMLYGYVAAYLYDVINATGSGKDSPPELPEATNVLESYIFPFFSYLTCCVVSFIPFGLIMWAAGKGWLPVPVTVVLGLATFALGVFILPMTLMVKAMFQSVGEAANPVVVLGSIGRIFPDYLAMFIATCFLWVGFGLAYAVVFVACTFTLGPPSADAVIHLQGVRVVSWVFFTIVTWPLFLYTWMVQGHLLGRLYRQGLRRLAWFVPQSEASRDAKRTSAGLALAAVAAVGALCGAAWFASKALQRMRSTPNASAFGTTCPIRDGTRLVYFWEHTDGMAGLTEYRFTKEPDGTLRIVASTTVAGQGSNGDEFLGTFDPETGVFVQGMTAWSQGVHHDGKKGEHVAFFGPKSSAIGTTYVNDWPVRGSERWQNAWGCWKVHDQKSTTDLYFDTKTGVLVGSRFGGIGFEIREWLVEAENAGGVAKGPPPNRNFDVEPGEPELTGPMGPMGPGPQIRTPFDGR